jgi:hypothetical protein
MKASVARDIISSRLLVLQSTRLQLNSLVRRNALHAQPKQTERIAVLREALSMAEHSYRTTVLTFGSAEQSDYWIVAYSRLIEMGNALSSKLEKASQELPPADRYEVASDVEMLETIVDNWSKMLRTAMAESVA